MNAAVQEQAAPIATVNKENPLDSIVENTAARRQAEAAKADALTARVYKDDPIAYTIALGRDYGLAAAHALNMIHIINGKPTLAAGARATFLQQAGYSWVPVEMTDKRVALKFSFRGEEMKDDAGKPLVVAMTMDEADRAEWPKNARGANKVGNWDKFPKNMLFARVISNFHRWFAPAVMGATVYDQAEILDSVVSETERRDAVIAAKTDSAVETLKEKLAEVSA